MSSFARLSVGVLLLLLSLAATSDAQEENLAFKRSDALEDGIMRLANDAVTTGTLAEDAVTSRTLANGAVTSRTLANGAVTSSTLANGAVTVDHLAAGEAVGPGSFTEDAITLLKLGRDLVTSDKIADNAVTGSAIADGTITSLTLSNGAVGTDHIANGAVTTDHIANGAVTTDLIADDSIKNVDSDNAQEDEDDATGFDEDGSGDDDCNTSLWEDVMYKCGPCSVLTNSVSKYKTCSAYCQAQEGGLICADAWEDDDNTCNVHASKQADCHTDFEAEWSTGDMVCQCQLIAECDLRDGAADIPENWLSALTVDLGIVTIIYEQEYEWGTSTPNLIGMEACADAFEWKSEPSVVPCDYLEWQGTIGINALLGCNYTIVDSSATTDVTIARVDLAFKTSRDVNANLVGNGQYSLVTTKTTSWPLLFSFQKNIEVKSDAVSFTTIYVPQTPVHTAYHFLIDTPDGVELDGSPDGRELEGSQRGRVKRFVADKLWLPADSILDFEMSFSFGRESVDFTVLGDWIDDPDNNDHELCDVNHLEGYYVVESTCKVPQVLLSLNVVTKREILSVGPDLISTATIGVFTAIQYPFVLVNPIHKNKDPALEYTDISIIGPCSVDTDCTRDIEWSMRDEKAKCTFTGSYEVELEVQCSSAFTSSLDDEGIPLRCPLAGGETVTLTVNLESGNHCPDAFVSINLPATSLVSTRGSDETSSFLNTQTIEFHANVRADDAGLQQAFFTEIAVENLDSDNGPQQLYSAQQYLADGNKLDLSVVDVDETDLPDGTDPWDLNSFLTPRFSFVADAAELGVALSETALLEVSATIEVVFQAGGSEIRRRFLLQARSGDASVQTKSNIILAGSAPVVPASSVVYNSAMRSGSSTVVVALSLCTALLVHFV